MVKGYLKFERDGERVREPLVNVPTSRGAHAVGTHSIGLIGGPQMEGQCLWRGGGTGRSVGEDAAARGGGAAASRMGDLGRGLDYGGSFSPMGEVSGGGFWAGPEG